MARTGTGDLPDALSKIFFASGLDNRHRGARTDLPVGQISLSDRAERHRPGRSAGRDTLIVPLQRRKAAVARSHGTPVLRDVVRIARTVHGGGKRRRFQNGRITLSLGGTGENFRGEVSLDG